MIEILPKSTVDWKESILSKTECRKLIKKIIREKKFVNKSKDLMAELSDLLEHESSELKTVTGSGNAFRQLISYTRKRLIGTGWTISHIKTKKDGFILKTYYFLKLTQIS